MRRKALTSRIHDLKAESLSKKRKMDHLQSIREIKSKQPGDEEKFDFIKRFTPLNRNQLSLVEESLPELLDAKERVHNEISRIIKDPVMGHIN